MANQSPLRLYKIRNPWRNDNEFSGSFRDGAAIWDTVGGNG